MTRENLWFLSAQAHHQAGRLDQALDAYREVLRAQPTHGEALTGLCQVLGALGRSDEAVPFLDRAIDPENELSSLDIAWRCFELGQIDEAIALFQDAESNFPERAHTAIATTIPGSPSNSNREILNARRSWALQCVPPGLGSVRNQARREGAPLRIGYLSSFFQHHNWMKPVWGLINRHNRALVQVNLFSDAPKDQIQYGYRPHPEDRYFDISLLSNEEAASEMERSGIDILVDLNGFSKADRLPLLGLRPAPVTVEWFNMYATSGISSVDYLIGDSVVIPPEEEKYYSERILRLDGCYLSFEFGYPAPPVATPPCGSGSGFTFGCLAPLYKITRNVAAAWSSILHRTPGSILYLRNSALGASDAVEYLQGLFRELDIPAGRLILDGPAEHYDFLRTYDEIDLALDTFPYSGGTTTTEALWQGVPVITFHGDRWAARTSASILIAAGLGEFVAGSLEEYISLAARIANSPDQRRSLMELRRNLRPQLSRSPVCDTSGLARNMEQIYQDIFYQNCGPG